MSDVHPHASTKKAVFNDSLFPAVFMYEKIANIEYLDKVSKVQHRRLKLLEKSLPRLKPEEHRLASKKFFALMADTGTPTQYHRKLHKPEGLP